MTTRLAAEALPLEWLADLTLLVGTRLGDVDDDANHGGDDQENCDGAEDGGGDFQLYSRLTAVETEGAACLGASLDFEGIPTTKVIVMIVVWLSLDVCSQVCLVKLNTVATSIAIKSVIPELLDYMYSSSLFSSPLNIASSNASSPSENSSQGDSAFQSEGSVCH